ncbi:putative P450 monooxygenase [Phaeosphaeriaceae sp. PMI808]|nr:putative P450 monooxygenase [Phaeosphaeriaceae sp. PMI808]
MFFLDFLSSLSLIEVASLILTAYVVYGLGLAIYRVYLSPLSRYPGPKLAAATLWYEFYYDVVKRGRFAWEIKRMHEKYGPVVRINPHELHVNDPDFYDELYTGQLRKRNKYQWSVNMFPSPDAMFATVDHDLHRRRRAAVAPYFSQQAIRRFDPVIRDKLEIFDKILEGYHETRQPVDLNLALAAMTTDIITEYSFGISYDFLKAHEFSPGWVPLLKGASENSLLVKQMPWLLKIMKRVPLALLAKIKPEMADVVRFQNGIAKRLQEVMSSSFKPNSDDVNPTIFHDILGSSLPASELTPERLQGEGETIVAAGSLTTAHYLASTIYHIIQDPSIFRRLDEELSQVMPNASIIPPIHNLSQLPYFNAVINEGFRLSHGVIARLTRIAPYEDLCVAGYTIPAGTPIGMSSWLTHLNPELFPSPDEFQPDRWLQPRADRLKKYILNFTKGSRMCLGKELAQTEIVYTLALIIRRWGGEKDGCMELYETTRADVDVEHDFFNPFPRFESKGIRVVLK